MEKIWYKEAVLYTLDVRSFKDGNGDGIGDFKGLLEKFDYLVELGINCLWILPFYKSRGRDFGYDVTDYYTVDPELGDLNDFKALVKKACEHDIKIIVDLIVNHTSNEHPWFLEAQKDKDSPYRGYYIWSKEKPENDKQKVIFKNVESSNWEYDKKGGEYYYHTFYSFQPDLNISNPKVREEILKIIDFWMKLGISGFRVDAAPHMIEKKGDEHFDKKPIKIFDSWKDKVISHYEEAILMGEVDVDPEDYDKYFKGNKFNGLFNFYCNNFLFYSLAVKEPKYLAQAFETLPEISNTTFYVNFLRNHDELDLERLTDEQRQRVYEVYAPEKDMRVYGRGIRRRLPPMVQNNRKILDLCFSLHFSLPGMPMVLYGEEIGMGDDLRLKERNSVRTAMQWSSEKNGGFTVENPTKLAWTVISGGEFGYENVNVRDQQQDENSLLQFVKKLIHLRRGTAAFCYGNFQQLPINHKHVMGHISRHAGKYAFAVHNFSEKSQSVHFSLDELEKNEIELIQGNCEFKIEKNQITINLPPYGFGWWA